MYNLRKENKMMAKRIKELEELAQRTQNQLKTHKEHSARDPPLRRKTTMDEAEEEDEPVRAINPTSAKKVD